MRKESVQMSAKTGAEGFFDVVREIFDVAKKNGQTDVFRGDFAREKSEQAPEGRRGKAWERKRGGLDVFGTSDCDVRGMKIR